MLILKEEKNIDTTFVEEHSFDKVDDKKEEQEAPEGEKIEEKPSEEKSEKKEENKVVNMKTYSPFSK